MTHEIETRWSPTATVSEILAEVRGDGTRTVEQQLTDLFDKFNLAARRIDPSIEGAWVGFDEGDGSWRRPFSIYFERKGSMFSRRKAG